MFVVANKSHSKVNNRTNDITACNEATGNRVNGERENIENFGHEDKLTPMLSCNSTEKKDAKDVSMTCQITVVTGHRKTRQKHRTKWNEKDRNDVSSDVRETDEMFARQTEEGNTGDVDVSDSFNHSQRKQTHKSLVRSAAHKKWRKEDISVDAVTDEMLLRQTEERHTCDVAVTETHNQSLSEEGRPWPLIAHKVMFPAVCDILEIIDEASSSRQLSGVSRTDIDGHSLREACTEAAKNCLVEMKSGQTRLATPGRAGNLGRSTPGRTGNQRQTPGRAGNKRRCTSLGANAVSPEGLKVTQGSAARDTRANAVSPEGSKAIQGSAARDTRANAVSPEGLKAIQGSAARDTRASALSPGFIRLLGSSPALKRNAKGETVLHRAAIKVV